MDSLLVKVVFLAASVAVLGLSLTWRLDALQRAADGLHVAVVLERR